MPVDMDETIKLDRRSFEALAADSRVRILKSLSKRRKTLSELAKELGLSVSTMKEHLDVLVGAGLIIQKDEGRKWKYYELTRKGSSIVEPRAFKVLVLLGFSLLLFLGAGWNFMNSFGAYSGELVDGAAGQAFMLGGAAAPAPTEEMDLEMGLGMETKAMAAEAPMEMAISGESGEQELLLGETNAGDSAIREEADWEHIVPAGEETGEFGAGTGEEEYHDAPGGEAYYSPGFPWLEAGLLGAAFALLAFAAYYAVK